MTSDAYKRLMAQTRRTFIITSLLSVPLLASYNFLAVILYRDLGGTPLQVTILTMIRPLVAVLALYWSFAVAGRSDRLKSNLIWSGVLARAPFFLCPLITSPWAFIAVAGVYMLLTRGAIPAWMEVFRLNLPKSSRSSTFSHGSAWGYVEGIGLVIAIGFLLDGNSDAWRWILPLSAATGLIGVAFQAVLPICHRRETVAKPNRQLGMFHVAIEPWKNAWKLMCDRPDFRAFQWGFMICGAGMMIIQPALPIFFVDVLGISYTELAIAMGISKGIGFAATSNFWARWWRHANVFHFSAAIFLMVALYPLLLLLAPVSRTFLYLGCLVYGIGQAGSEMCWHLSGTAFAKEKDSSLFTGVNVAMVGLRGAIVPPIGIALCMVMGPGWVFVTSAVLCVGGAVTMRLWSETPAEAVA